MTSFEVFLCLGDEFEFNPVHVRHFYAKSVRGADSPLHILDLVKARITKFGE